MQVRTAINQNKDQQTKFTCHERPPRATKMQEGRQAAGILPCLPRKSLKRSSNPGALYPLTTLVAPLAFQISSFGHWGLACSPLRRQIPISNTLRGVHHCLYLYRFWDIQRRITVCLWNLG